MAPFLCTRRTSGVIVYLAILAMTVVEAPAKTVHLSELQIARITQGWGAPCRNRSVGSNTLRIAHQSFTDGIGSHANSECCIRLDGQASRFRATVGVDAESGPKASVEFIVSLDGKALWRSGVMRTVDQAKTLDIPLAGGRELLLQITDGGDGIDSDHADWANAVITYEGETPRIVSTFIEFPPVVDAPGAPPNTPAVLKVDPDGTSFALEYDDNAILTGALPQHATVTSTVAGDKVLTQRIRIRCNQTAQISAVVHAGAEAIAAETRGQAQEQLPLIRTSHGLSNNLRNNAVYDRDHDWMLEFPDSTRIRAFRKANGTTRFELTIPAEEGEVVFRPRYYQKHKNIPHFQPWTYRIRKDSITGWCSWWAYMRNCRQSDVDAVMKTWNDKHLGDYGYRFIQLDDAFQGGADQNRRIPSNAMRNYVGGRPETWLKWKTDKFPDGMLGYIRSVEDAHFVPGIWIGCFFTDLEIAEQHPDWFVQGSDGKPYVGAWVTYVLDSTNPEAADSIIRPTFRGLKDAGFAYVKIDQLRHMLYDNLNHNHEYLARRGKRPDDIFRGYLQIAREELGDDSFILSCWGVLPESIGLADACRIGGDGYGPVTMQQYNSWNGIVWRNDPDHCDVSPRNKAKDTGNVLSRTQVTAANNDTIIRPALASIAGCMLMLSDKPDIYEDDRNLVGVRRSAPVLFSVPGQLYDFDPRKTDVVKMTDRATIRSGTGTSSIDGDQFGHVCPFWLNEFNTSWGNWHVLHRLNWTGSSKTTAPATTVRFSDLGLDPSKQYIVHEFWSDRTLGVLEGEISLGELEPMGLESLAIREKLNRPQLISTNRHLSQGAAEIEVLQWSDNVLSGRSRVVVDDNYVVTIHVPTGYKLASATINQQQAQTEQQGNTLRLSYQPNRTGLIDWSTSFER